MLSIGGPSAAIMAPMRSTVLAAVSAFVALGACASDPRSFDQLPDELRTATVVSTFEPGARVPNSATFSWMPGSFVRLDERFDAAKTERDICAIVEAGMNRRGLYLVPENRGDLWVGYAVAVEGALDGARLDDLYGVSGRRQTVQHERGALVLDVVDRATKRPIWRGSVAILTDPSLPEGVRRARVERGVEQLLEQLKAGY